MTTQEIIEECTTEGNVVKLPPRQLPRDEYMQVKKALEGIGGKWVGGKVFGFQFQIEPTPLLKRLSGGEDVNLKRGFQFFPTPDTLADDLVQLASIGEKDIVLEPSAGQGAIINAIHRRHPKLLVNCYELMDVNRVFLEKIKNVCILGDDFLTATARKFTRIVANPPFSKNQDIAHIQHMYKHLADGGIMVSVASAHWEHSSNKKETNFRKWLFDLKAQIITVPAGTFKSSGTDVESRIIVIKKD